MTKSRNNTSPKFHTQQLSLIGLMTAVLCLLGPFSLVLPISPVPISLGTMAVYFIAMVLGPKPGTVSVLIYLLLGLVGLPVFTGFTGGPGKLFGPTGGYLLGYVFLAVICGFFAKKFSNILVQLAGMLLGTAICYLLGSLWLAYQLSLSLTEALAAGVLPYLPGDFVKLLLALLVGRQLRSRLRKLEFIP